MRIRIMRTPPVPSIDGVRIDLFEPGREYAVGNSIAAVMLAEGWAVPVAFDEPPPPPVVEADPFREPISRDLDSPPNLTRELYPPFFDNLTNVAAEFERRRRRKR
jgi:hypothetical protein